MTPDTTPQEPDRQQVIRDQRRRFQERFRLNPLAFSVDGRTFTFQSPMGLAVSAGVHVRLTRMDGVVLLGQILSQTIEKTQGAALTVTDEGNTELASVGLSISEAVVHMPNYSIQGSGIVLGTLVEGETPASDLAPGFSDAELAPATAEDISGYLAAWGSRRAPLPIGSIALPQGAIAASIDASGFNRHSFLCGQSGSGKTYSLGVVLERLLAHTDLRIVILDPNADYVKLGQLSDPGQADTVEGRRYLERVDDLRVFRPTAAVDDASQPLRVRFSDLSTDDQARTLRLDPLADRSEFDTTMRIISRMGRPRYSLQDVQHAGSDDLSEATRQVMLRMTNLGVSRWDIWAEHDQPSIADALEGAWRSLVFDLSRFERAIERSVVALATLRHFWRNRESRQPVLLVIDEAHNVCPTEPMDPIQAAVTDLLIAIAGEGRKYGLYLFLATQRPDKLHPNVISQCDNLMLMRMNSQTDIEDLARIFSFVPRGMLNEASAFRQGEALLAGKLVPSPTIMRIGSRLSAEGGSDVATTWARPGGDTATRPEATGPQAGS
jgi:hypothetical protein